MAPQDVTKLNNFAGESERGRGKIRVRQSTAHKKGLPQEAMEIEYSAMRVLPPAPRPDRRQCTASPDLCGHRA
ncbi:TPA: hypothetical protein MH279_09145 [Klebsiella pneumoniae]|nr:hypothetical protein [Klebsiella pneumoniae]